jgi:putative spermidine/putrescine transport system substrate-binding protein
MTGQFRRGFGLLASLALVLGACSSGGGDAATNLTTIALPHDWCNYGEMLTAFNKKTNIKLNELNPQGGSGDEIEAIKANKSNKGPQAPDVIDVGISFGPAAKAEGLLMNYKVPTWDTIPASVKDADGAWYGDYYGVLSFEVNKAVAKSVPKDWKDLLGADFKKSVALAGDPTASNQAIQSVYAAALANGGSLDDATKGLEFFKQLKEAGNLVPVVATQATLASGETPVVITWSYLALADRDALKGNPAVEVVIPASGRFAGMYAQAISAYAPHPEAAKKYMDFLYSDEGQLNWLKGYCYTTRYEDLVKRNVVPADLKAKLPDVTGAVFPTADQLAKAKTLITDPAKGWKGVVGVDVKKKS